MRAAECPGLTEHVAGEHLAELASRVPQNRAIVEIGVFQARSLLYLAEGSAAGNRAPVWGIDPWNLPRPSKPKYSSDETYQAALSHVASSGSADLISLIRGFSNTEADAWHGTPIGLLYVDADHRYQPVLDDFYSWEPHLAPGAVLAWDDVHEDFPGVIKAVRELHRRGEITAPTLAPGCSRLAVATWLG